MKSHFLKIIIIFIFFIVGHNVYAQAFNLYTENDIFTETIPEIPGPNEEVSLKLKSYSFNLNNYYITWFLNGQKQSAGYGNREFTFKTGNTGERTRITAVIDTDGKIFRKKFNFVPAEVDLMWEAIDAYTPPFYRGKAIPLPQALIRVTAIPETQLIAPSDAPNLIYYWDRNYKRDIPSSGFGKNSFTFISDPLVYTEEIKVTTNDRRENSFARNSLKIPIKDNKAEILFYKTNKNGRIMVNKALNTNTNIGSNTIKLTFHPLNMSTTKQNFTDLFVGWSINGKNQAPQNFSNQSELYITSGEQSGTTSIGLKLEGIDKMFQKGETSINLKLSNE